MIKVLIDLDSIKPHPQAGQSQTMIVREGQTEFEYKGKNSATIIDYYQQNNDCGYIIDKAEQMFNGPIGDYVLIKGFVTDKSKIEKLKQFGVVNFIFNNDHVVFKHHPNPGYLFEYEKTKLKCSDFELYGFG